MFTIAIGDIHGCLPELTQLISDLQKYHNRDDVRWVFLGDYVDRGPNVKGCIDLLLKFRETNNCVFLKGNHEDMMIASQDSVYDNMHWRRNGGKETEASYGKVPFGNFPLEHRIFFQSLVSSYENETHFFCHAGCHPAYALDNQLEQDLLWIRQSFLHSDHDFGKMIVHGHSPLKTFQYEIKSNRINLDTGCVFGGYLTAAIFENGNHLKMMQVKSNYSWRHE